MYTFFKENRPIKVFSKLNLTQTDKSSWFNSRNKIVLIFNLTSRCLETKPVKETQIYSFYLQVSGRVCALETLLFYAITFISATQGIGLKKGRVQGGEEMLEDDWVAAFLSSGILGSPKLLTPKGPSEQWSILRVQQISDFFVFS